MPKGLDASAPSSARVWNALLGGKDNYLVDQEVVHRILRVAPGTRMLAWSSRQFLGKAIEMAVRAGIGQHIDLGTGFAAWPNVHEIAWEHDRSARVVYVDDDAVVYAHGNVMVHPPSMAGAQMMLADIRRTDDLIARLCTEAGIDFGRPVTLIMCGVLDYVMDEDDPGQILAQLRDTVAPGSHLALTHCTDRSDSDLITLIKGDTDGTAAQCVFRSVEQIAAFTEGWVPLEPGLAPIQQWLCPGLPATRLDIAGGVYRKG